LPGGTRPGPPSDKGMERHAIAEVEAPAPESLPGAEPFDYSTIPPGHYDLAYRRRRGIQSKWHHLKFQRVADQVAGYRRVLDVGCGPGTLLGALTDDHESVGVDITHQQIDYAREVYGSESRTFYACALEELPADLEPFDAVTAVELIEHLPQALAESTLRDAVGRLRPGGKLVLTTPNFRSAWPLIERMVDRLGDVSYYVQHINKFNRGRFRDLLRDLGLRDVEVHSYLAFAPFSAALGWRLADRVARLESGWIEDHLGLIMIASGVKPE
jgi:SAM-dependent methyltransferase